MIMFGNRMTGKSQSVLKNGLGLVLLIVITSIPEQVCASSTVQTTSPQNETEIVENQVTAADQTKDKPCAKHGHPAQMKSLLKIASLLFSNPLNRNSHVEITLPKKVSLYEIPLDRANRLINLRAGVRYSLASPEFPESTNTDRDLWVTLVSSGASHLNISCPSFSLSGGQPCTENYLMVKETPFCGKVEEGPSGLFESPVTVRLRQRQRNNEHNQTHNRRAYIQQTPKPDTDQPNAWFMCHVIAH